MAIFQQQTISEQGPMCPVCGLTISDMRHAFTKEHHGLLLAFDRQECLKEFLENPEKYSVSKPE